MRKLFKLASVVVALGCVSININGMNDWKQNICNKFRDVSITELAPTPEETDSAREKVFLITVDQEYEMEIVENYLRNLGINMHYIIQHESWQSEEDDDESNTNMSQYESRQYKVINFEYCNYSAEHKRNASQMIERTKKKVIHRHLEINNSYDDKLIIDENYVKQMLMTYLFNLDRNLNFRITVNLGQRYPNSMFRTANEFLAMIRDTFGISEENITEKGGHIRFFVGKDYPRQRIEDYQAWAMDKSTYTWDLTRFVILCNTFTNDYNSFWFKYEMPSYLLYKYAEDIFPDLQEQNYVLKVKLNDDSIKFVNKSNDGTTLRNLSAFHRIEMSAVPEYRLLQNNRIEPR